VQQLQVLGQVGLTQSGGGRDLGHGALALPQRLEDLESGRLAQRLEALGDDGEERRRQAGRRVARGPP
jgi:hypothetical protein